MPTTARRCCCAITSRAWGLQTSFVDMTDPAAIEAAVTPRTRLIWAETPSNPRLHVTDIAAAAAIARRAGARLAVDNTWATPVLQRPLELGADLVMHSTTKYLGGHSDVLGGVRHRPRSGRLLRARADHSDRGGRRAVAVRLLARAARDPLAAVPHARPRRGRATARRVPWRATRRSSACTSRGWRQIRARRRVASDARGRRRCCRLVCGAAARRPLHWRRA